MNIHKLLEKAQAFLSSEDRKRKEKRSYLKQLIRKLRRHEIALKERLKTESNESARAKIVKKIALAHAQRKKGLKRLKALKKGAKSK